MRILPATAANIEHALRILQEGGSIAHATETCYGLACDITNIDAVRRLFAIKQRALNQAISGLFASIEQAKEYVEWNKTAEELATKYFPGPLTIILRVRKEKAERIFPTLNGLQTTNYKLQTIGIRISSHPLAMELVERFGKPLTTTSANVSTLPSPYSTEEIAQQFKNENLQPDLVIDCGALEKIDASTVVDCTGNTLRILRQGTIAISV